MAILKRIPYKRWLIAVIPLAMFVVYTTILAKEKFRSEGVYVIHDLSSKAKSSIDFGIFGSSDSTQKIDANIVVEYLRSMDVLQKLDRQFYLWDRYSSDKTDLTERLFSGATAEDFLDLYRNNLKVVVDETTGITKIAFDSTDPEISAAVLRFLLVEGETFLNDLNHNRAKKRLEFFTSQLESNKNQLDQANKSLEAFQNRYRTVDPSSNLTLNQNIISNIETEIVKKSAEYNQLISYMSPQTIDAIKLKTEIKELQAALEKIKDRLSGDQAELLNDLLFEYQHLKNNVDFATEIYRNNLVQYESNKIEAVQHSKIFEVIAAPQLPDGHVYPQRAKMIFTATILVAILYKSALMLWAIIQDHKD